MIAPVVLATFMEHIGDITTNGTVVGQNFIENPGLNRTLLGDGLATIFAGFAGGPANTTYGENTGVLELSRVHDPRVIRIAAVFANKATPKTLNRVTGVILVILGIVVFLFSLWG